jgi:hypothetical protein
MHVHVTETYQLPPFDLCMGCRLITKHNESDGKEELVLMRSRMGTIESLGVL